MGFVKLDDGRGAFDDILQAQRFQGGLQQQSFQNTLAVEEHQAREAQGQQHLEIQRQRNDILARDSRRRSVASSMSLAGRGVAQRGPVPGIGEMAEYLGQRNPDALAEILTRYEGVELDDSIDPDDWASTDEGAAFMEDMSGAFLAVKGAEAAQVAERAALGMERLAADPRTGLGEKDLAPVLDMLQGGKATGPEITAAYQALRTKAASNIGFHEMRTAVLGEAANVWGQAMAQMRAGAGGSGGLGLEEEAPAEALMRLRGEIETAETPEELLRARGAYMIKAHNLDGVVSEMEAAAFEAGRTAATALFEQERAGALGQPVRQRAQAPQQGAGGAPSAAQYPNLAKIVEPPKTPEQLEQDRRDEVVRAALESAGFTGDGSDLTPAQVKEAQRIAADVNKNLDAGEAEKQAKVDAKMEKRVRQTVHRFGHTLEDNADKSDEALATILMHEQAANESEQIAGGFTRVTGDRADTLAYIKAWRSMRGKKGAAAPTVTPPAAPKNALFDPIPRDN